MSRAVLLHGGAGLPRIHAHPDREMAAELIARVREEGLCAGVHIMAVGAEEAVPPL